MPQVGFEPTISAGERPQTYALDRTATGIGTDCRYSIILSHHSVLGLNILRILNNVIKKCLGFFHFGE